MKTSTQLKARVRNLSREKHVEAEVILRNFMLERLLERIAASKYKNNFILKGGMLIAAMVGIDTRTTMDLNASIKGQSLTETGTIAIMQDILRVTVNDNVTLAFSGIEEIREEADYPGFRVSIDAILDKTRQTLKVDITTGDFITPREIEYRFPLMFEDRTIGILSYTPETILAEKFETIITRGVTNTRMRDFYDIHILTVTQTIRMDIFRAALHATAEKRHTSQQMRDVSDVIQTIADSGIMAKLWRRYQAKYHYAADITWETAVAALWKLAQVNLA